MHHEIELRLFGEPCVLRGGQAAALGSRKALALLAVLALEGHVQRERLAGLLWPTVDAAAARRNLRRELFRLRSLGLTLADAPGAPLQLDACWSVDARRFRAAVDAGDDATALALSGPAALVGLDDVADAAFDRWLAEQRTALAGARQRVRERLARQLVDRGDGAPALDLWLQALEEDPCQEAALSAAMTLLRDRGDAARALAIYERSVAALRQTLDVAPSPSLQTLAAVLRRGASIAQQPAEVADGLPPRAVASRTSTPPMHRVVRQAAVERVLAAWQRRRRVYLAGVPGIGKTQLACDCAAQHGGWARIPCRVDDAEQPYSTAIRALEVLRDAAPDVDLPAWSRRELAQLLPELGDAPRPLDTPAARQRLLTAFAEAIARLAHDNFAALVIDDWQWCDDDSQVLLASLGRRDQGPVCVVVFRSAELPPVLLQSMRDEVDGGAAERVDLDGFDEADTRELLAGPTARDSDDAATRVLAARLHAATGGNPFFLVETLRHLRERGWLVSDAQGRWHAADHAPSGRGHELPLPGRVRDTVLARVRALGEAARRNLEAAALLGGSFDAALLDGVADTTADDLVALLEHAEAARLVRADGRGYRFAHQLVGQCLAESLSPARRQMLHARWAQRLMQRQAPPALVAAQLEQAHQPALALRWRLAAGDAAQRVHALADAQHQFEQALADGPGADDAVRAHLALARLHQLRADPAAATLAIAAALQAAAQAGAEPRLEARLAHVHNRLLAQQPDPALAVLDGMAGELAQAGPALRARACVARGNALRLLGRYDDARTADDEAVAQLEAVPDALGQLGQVLDGVARRLLSRGQPLDALQYARRAVAALESVDEPGALARALVILGVALVHASGHRESPGPVFERARALAARCGDVEEQRAAILNLVKLHTDAGDAAAALALLDEGEALAPRFDNLNIEQGFLVARYYVHYMRGDVHAADAAARRLMSTLRAMTNRKPLLEGVAQLLDLYLHSSRLADAQRLLDEAVEAAAQGGTPRPLPLELGLKTVWLRLLGGDPAGALTELRAVERAAATGAHPAYASFEATLLQARIGAEVELALGDIAAAARRLAAVDLDQAMPVDHEALLLVQHLGVAMRSGTVPKALRQRAQGLLDSGRVPAFEAAALGQALRSA